MAFENRLREIWLLMDEEVNFQGHARELSDNRRRKKVLKENINRGDNSGLSELETVTSEIHRLNRVMEIRLRNNNGQLETRREIYVEVYNVTNILLEEMGQETWPSRLAQRQDVIQLSDLSMSHLDPTAHRIIKYLVYYCMQEHMYVSMEGAAPIYEELRHYYRDLHCLGETMIRIGNQYRNKFRNVIRAGRLLKTVTAEQFKECVTFGMIEIFDFYYLPNSAHLTFLIVTAFAIEIIYYIRDFDKSLGRDRIILTVALLCSLLSSNAFNRRGRGLNTLVWYGSAIYRGHRINPLFEYMTQNDIRFKDMFTISMPWHFLENDPEQLNRELPVPRTRSMSSSLENLERLPAGTSATNIEAALASAETTSKRHR